MLSAAGKNVYHFDNKTAIDVPFSIMEKYTGDESMTISVWVWMKKQDRTQYILAATDPQRLDRKHFGLYTEGEFSTQDVAPVVRFSLFSG